MVYQRHYWKDYDENKTETQNIEAGAVVTTEKLNEIENGIVANYSELDIKKSDKTYVDSMLSSIAQGGPRELFYSLAALKTKYPSGADGTYLVFDSATTNGAHSYMWDTANKNWKDLGVYQATAIAENSIETKMFKNRSVTSEKVESVSEQALMDGYTNLQSLNADSILYNGLTISSIADTFKFIKNAGDAGFRVKLQAPNGKALKNLSTLKLYFQYKKISSIPSTPIDTLDRIFISTKDKELTSGAIGAVNNMADTGEWIERTLEIPSETLVSKGVGEDQFCYITLLFSGGAGLIEGRYWYANENEYKVSLNHVREKVDNIQTYQLGDDVVTEEKLDSNMPARSISPNFVDPTIAIAPTSAYSLASKAQGVSFEKISAGDNYFYFPVTLSESQMGKELYVSFEVSGDRLSQSQWEFYYISIGGVLRQPRLFRFGPDKVNFRRYKFKIPAVKREEFDGNSGFWLSFWTHGSVGQKGEIRNMRVSDVPFEKDLPEAIENIDFLDSTSELIGDYPVPKMSTVYAPTVPKNILAFTNNSPVQYDGMVLTKIVIYSSVRNADYSVSIANLDQRNLLVNEQDITSLLPALEVGINVFDVSMHNLKIDKGQYVIVKSAVLQLFTNPSLRVSSLIQDTDHSISESGYEGYTFYQSQLQSPLFYEVKEQSRIQKAEDTISALEKKIEDISSGEKQTILTSPDGSKFRLQVTDNGQLTAVSLIPQNVVMMGNSITSEKGGIGMAASDQYHDWYYLTRQFITSKNPQAVFTDRKNITVWESGAVSTGDTISDRRQFWWDRIGTTLVPNEADLVILQLGDNVNTEEREATLEDDVATLILNIKNHAPKARVLFVACWYGDETKVGKIKRGCIAGGGEFVDITDTTGDKRSYIGATRTGIDGVSWTVESSGEASHPGDNGMVYIANQVISTLAI